MLKAFRFFSLPILFGASRGFSDFHDSSCPCWPFAGGVALAEVPLFLDFGVVRNWWILPSFSANKKVQWLNGFPNWCIRLFLFFFQILLNMKFTGYQNFNCSLVENSYWNMKNIELFFFNPPLSNFWTLFAKTPQVRRNGSWVVSPCCLVGPWKGAPLRKLVNEAKPGRKFGAGVLGGVRGGWMNETLSNLRRFDMVGVCFSWCFLAAKTAGKMFVQTLHCSSMFGDNDHLQMHSYSLRWNATQSNYLKIRQQWFLHFLMFLLKK